MSKPTISGYTTSYQCKEMRYPIKLCLESLLNFCDEVVVVDGGSSDGTTEELLAFAKREKRLKVFVEPIDFSHPRWAIHMDGAMKAKARARCTADYCWQTDTDEIVPVECIPFIKDIIPLAAEKVVVGLPMVEFWGSFQRFRADFPMWKPRFSKNDPDITHGVPVELGLYDNAGHRYPRPYDSDSCNYITVKERNGIPVITTVQAPQVNTIEAYQEWYEGLLKRLPYVLHLSWLSLRRKIEHYRAFWPKFHASMYNHSHEDSGATNVLFDKPWSQVTDSDIETKVIELERNGPRSFHTKKTVWQGLTLPYRGEIPHTLKSWVECNL